MSIAAGFVMLILDTLFSLAINIMFPLLTGYLTDYNSYITITGYNG